MTTKSIPYRQKAARPHTLFGLAMALGFGGVASGAQASNLILVGSAGFASQYVRRGVEHSTLAAQGGIDGRIGGLKGRAWFSRPLDTDDPEELQTAIGYLWNASKKVSLEVSGTHFWYINTPLRAGASHSFEGEVKANWNVHSLFKFSISSAYDIRFRSQNLEGAVSYDVPLKSLGTFFESRVYAGTLAGKDVLPNTSTSATRDSYTYWGADIRLPYRVGMQTAIALSGHLSETRGQNRYWSPMLKASGTRTWVTLSAEYEF